MTDKPREAQALHEDLCVSDPGPADSRSPLSPAPDHLPVAGDLCVMEMISNSGRWSLFSAFRLISLKVLNSIVLLGKSCQYVKEAKMEEKLFSRPPTSTPGKPPSKSQSKCKPSQGRLGAGRHFSVSFSEASLSELSLVERRERVPSWR